MEGRESSVSPLLSPPIQGRGGETPSVSLLCVLSEERKREEKVEGEETPQASPALFRK